MVRSGSPDLSGSGTVAGCRLSLCSFGWVAACLASIAAEKQPAKAWTDADACRSSWWACLWPLLVVLHPPAVRAAWWHPLPRQRLCWSSSRRAGFAWGWAAEQRQYLTW